MSRRLARPALLLVASLALAAPGSAQFRVSPDPEPLPIPQRAAVPSVGAEPTLLVPAALADQAAAGANPHSAAELRRGVWVGTLGTLLPIAVGTALVAGADIESDEAGGGLLLGTAGLLLGPSLGDFAVRRPGRGMLGFGLRTLAFAGGVAGAGLLCGWDACDYESAAWVALLGGTALATSSAVHDLARLTREAREADQADAAANGRAAEPPPAP